MKYYKMESDKSKRHEFGMNLTICLHTVKPVCNDHLYNEIYYLWFIQ